METKAKESLLNDSYLFRRDIRFHNSRYNCAERIEKSRKTHKLYDNGQR